jgi:hypothetical protein
MIYKISEGFNLDTKNHNSTFYDDYGIQNRSSMYASINNVSHLTSQMKGTDADFNKSQSVLSA